MFSDEFRFNLQYDSRRTLIWRTPGTRYHQVRGMVLDIVVIVSRTEHAVDEEDAAEIDKEEIDQKWLEQYLLQN
ncbi:hypothetical protein TNCV_2732881 [Trichonephila clavipes]|nr:hypothetical protein TNCV_2732881 [Trichonephila clavipes]